MAIELDDVAQERKRKYIEDQMSLEYWARSGFSSGYATLDDRLAQSNKETDNEDE